jgi:serine/threonine-protein kinase HipA
LPGAVVARLEAGVAPKVVKGAPDADADVVAHPPIRFSLAGVQLKFQMMNDRGSVTLPMYDDSGDVVLKTPSKGYPLLPEAEYTAMMLAEAAGISVAECYLVDAADIEGIPEHLHGNGQRSLAVKRCDRTDGGGRVHIEDFAQIYEAFGEAKYTKGNDATTVATVNRFATDGRGEMLESVRRVVVNILVGNGDAHLKNWSFIYPKPGVVALSPAYDVVPTYLFGDNSMALVFGGTKNPYAMGIRKFERLAGLMKIEPRVVLKDIRPPSGVRSKGGLTSLKRVRSLKWPGRVSWGGWRSFALLARSPPNGSPTMA